MTDAIPFQDTPEFIIKRVRQQLAETAVGISEEYDYVLKKGYIVSFLNLLNSVYRYQDNKSDTFESCSAWYTDFRAYHNKLMKAAGNGAMSSRNAEIVQKIDDIMLRNLSNAMSLDVCWKLERADALYIIPRILPQSWRDAIAERLVTLRPSGWIPGLSIPQKLGKYAA